VDDSAFDVHMSYRKEQEAFFNPDKEVRASIKNRTAWGLLLWNLNNEDGRYYRMDASELITVIEDYGLSGLRV
jgi:hypothetical protein